MNTDLPDAYCRQACLITVSQYFAGMSPYIDVWASLTCGRTMFRQVSFLSDFSPQTQSLSFDNLRNRIREPFFNSCAWIHPLALVLRLTHRRLDRFSFPILSIAGQRLVLNLRGMQTRPYTSSYVSRIVDQQLVVMGDERWNAINVVSPGAGTTDLEMELVERPAR